MSDHWSDRKPHPFDPSYSVPKPFPICVVCGFGPSHPLHQVVKAKEAA